jgi:hypothetical protein
MRFGRLSEFTRSRGWLVGADLLTDCGDGCYWQGYCEWLEAIQPTDEVPATQALN